MGCGESRQAAQTDKKVVTDVTKINLNTLSRAERFELNIPITLTDVDIYCKAIRAIQPDKQSITIPQLLEGMSALEPWKKVPQGGIFTQILAESPLLKDSENKD